MAQHYSSSVLDSLPDWLRRLDESSGGVLMGEWGVSGDQLEEDTQLTPVAQPNLNQPVLVYIRQDCGSIKLDEDELAELTKGSTHLVRYKDVERWVQLGWAEVLL